MSTQSIQEITAWMFRQVGQDEWLQATVPGCVHTDLLKNNKIPDPFYGMNEADLQWIDKQDWEYQTVFQVPPNLRNHENLFLIFEGLDTYADVYLNGEHILAADNMFRSWRTDVKHLLTNGENTLLVRFRSPVQEDLPKLEGLGYSLPATNDQSERGELGDKKVSIFARKAPYHYGWDWGPRFVTSGIWRKVNLVGWSAAKIEDFYIRQNDVRTELARLTAVFDVKSDEDWQGEIRLSTDGVDILRDISMNSGMNHVEFDFAIEHPKLWWSRGLGDAHLYQFTASLIRDGKVVAEKTVRTGLRSIRVIQEPDSKGTSFYFELNGEPVFAKGANHIPNDSFLNEVSYERYQHEIVSAVEANMNMLRVWGGGIYEEDVFYDLCDEHGILVWQDFMFACSMYPGDKAFLDNVRLEAEENVKRLRNHPCLAIWCGNNEIDTAWSHYDTDAGWGWKEQYPELLREKIWSDYEAIFHHVLPAVVKALMPDVFYWPSSPMKALTRDKNQHASNDSTQGDIHYWGVWHNVEPFANYNVYLGRFMSEYGFQSFPEEKTVRTYAADEDMALESEVMLWHQRSGPGNQLIKQYMDIYSKEPRDFPSFLYMSQILQAEAIQSAIEAHRRKKPYCMGTLYWQINDCWPVASWSSMDYYGRWKALQYFAKRSYSDILVSIDGTNDATVDVHVISDSLNEISGKVTVKLFHFDGKLLFEKSEHVTVQKNSTCMVHSFSVEELTQGQNKREIVLVVDFESGGDILSTSHHYFVSTKDIRLQAPLIEVKEHLADGVVRITLTSQALARHVWLDCENEGIFTDNFFDLIPGIPKTVTFLSRQPELGGFVPGEPSTLTVRSLADFAR